MLEWDFETWIVLKPLSVPCDGHTQEHWQIEDTHNTLA